MKKLKKALPLIVTFSILFGTVSSFAGDWCHVIPHVWLDNHSYTNCADTKANYNTIVASVKNAHSANQRYRVARDVLVNCKQEWYQVLPPYIGSFALIGVGAASSLLPGGLVLTEPMVAFGIEDLATNVASTGADKYAEYLAKQEVLAAIQQLNNADSNVKHARDVFKAHTNQNNCYHTGGY